MGTLGCRRKHGKMTTTFRGRRVLFLDFDGVLHPYGPLAGTGPLGPRAVHYSGVLCWLHHLATILRPFPDVEVVIHSSWREGYSLEELSGFLEELGPRTIAMAPPGKRSQAIEAWLAEQTTPVTSYRILDDQTRQFSRSALRPFLIPCPRLKGVSAGVVQRELQEWLTAR